MTTEYHFDSRAAASVAAADCIAEHLSARLDLDTKAAFVVGGGTTPGACFASLSARKLDWKNITIALSDERWVAPDHADSNEGLIEGELRTNAAASANVLSIYQTSTTVEERCLALQADYPALGFACAMVGMGGDGHFASLFPDATNLGDGLRSDNERLYMPVRTAASPHPRVSMTLAALLRSDEIILLFFGDEKRAVFEAALGGDESYPVYHLLQQSDTPVRVYWAP